MQKAPLRHSGEEAVSQLYLCHSVQAKRDMESSISNKFWIPAFAGKTPLMALPVIVTQPRKPESRIKKISMKLYLGFRQKG